MYAQGGVDGDDVTRELSHARTSTSVRVWKFGGSFGLQSSGARAEVLELLARDGATRNLEPLLRNQNELKMSISDGELVFYSHFLTCKGENKTVK